jgi:hypothetical protein
MADRRKAQGYHRRARQPDERDHPLVPRRRPFPQAIKRRYQRRPGLAAVEASSVDDHPQEEYEPPKAVCRRWTGWLSRERIAPSVGPLGASVLAFGGAFAATLVAGVDHLDR